MLCIALLLLLFGQARGLVESWLSSVESNMRLTLKALAKKALRDYSSSRRPGWVLAQPAQLAVLASNIHWGQVGLAQHSSCITRCCF
jgi:hypothetical protein